MHKSIMLFCCVWVGLLSFNAYSQLSEQPLSKLNSAKVQTHQVTLTPMSLQTSKAKAFSQASMPIQFAEPVSYELDMQDVPSWQIVNHQGQSIAVMRMSIKSPNALSINFGFEDYEMPPGGRLFIYSKNYNNLIGPFTDKDNEEHGELWTPVIDGEELTIEINVPAMYKDDVDIELDKVNRGFIDINRLAKQLPATKSGSCNVDVVCPVAEDWQDQIRSVARYTRSGIFLCSGAAINNTANDKRAYFLTANHCGVNESNAASVVAYWNYQNATCRSVGSVTSGQPGNGSLEQFNSGAVLRARHQATDMALLEFDDPILLAANVYLSGWNRARAEPATGVGIHHPRGQEKRISFDGGPVQVQQTEIRIGNNLYFPGNLLRVRDWDLGTTEGGSSGSPLYDQDQRIVGQLTGGFAACGNNASDWYGRLAMSWDGGGTMETSLRGWLDPLNNGSAALNGTESLEVDRFEPDNDDERAKFINSGVPQRRSLHEIVDKDWLTFRLKERADIELSVQAGPNDKIQVTLMDENGTQLGQDADSSARIVVNNLAAGSYFIKVNDYNLDDYIGFYKTTLNIFNRDEFENDDDEELAKLIGVGETQRRSLYPEFDQDWVRFELNSSESIQISTSGQLGDTELRLYDQSFNELVYNNDIGDSLFSEIRADLSEGTYYIQVSELNDQPIAAYDLSITVEDDFLLMVMPAILAAAKKKAAATKQKKAQATLRNNLKH